MLFVQIQKKKKPHSKNIFKNVQNYKFQGALQKTFTKIGSAYEQNCPGGKWQHPSTYILHAGIISHFCAFQEFSLQIIWKILGLVHKLPSWTRQKFAQHAIKQNNRGSYNIIKEIWVVFKSLSHRGIMPWFNVRRNSLGNSSTTFKSFYLCQALQVN